MDENIELLEYIYKSSEMGTLSCTKLIRDINGKENKIKKVVENILKEYESFQDESEKLINKNDYEIKENSMMTKMSSSMGVKMEVMKDNSDANIAHLLTQGLTMGIVDVSSKIDNYKDEVDSKILKLAKKYLKFQQETVEELKEYL